MIAVVRSRVRSCESMLLRKEKLFDRRGSCLQIDRSVYFSPPKLEYTKYILTIASIWRENILGYLSADMFRDANRFPRAKLKENCELRGTDNVQGQIFEQISAPNGDYCFYYPSNIFKQRRSNLETFSDKQLCRRSKYFLSI